MNRPLFIRLSLTIATFALAIAGAHAAGVWINTTDSLPVGLWLETTPHPIRAGDVVLVCLPATPAIEIGASRGYIALGSCPSGLETLLKPVAAAPGDDVDVALAGISVNGHPIQHSAQLAKDSKGRGLPVVAPGHYHVSPGELWLVSAYNSASFDSRYFGPIPAAGVRGTARPLWVGK